mgnify:CR=1 FL=1
MPVTNRKIIVGVCAMEKKAKSKAMSAILTRLEKFGEFEILVFGDERILREPVEEWPKVDALLSWFSDGFPLAKAEAYAKLHKPFVVNNLNRQWDLLDRRQRGFIIGRTNVGCHVRGRGARGVIGPHTPTDAVPMIALQVEGSDDAGAHSSEEEGGEPEGGLEDISPMNPTRVAPGVNNQASRSVGRYSGGISI